MKRLVVIIVAAAAALAVAWVARPREAAAIAMPALPPILDTSRDGLDEGVAAARRRLAANPGDAAAALRLAEMLLRQARVEGDAERAIDAERVLDHILAVEPSDFSALKALGAVYLAQHRFADARDAARRALRVREDDAWSHGVLGDALLELGEYDAAFDAYDTMVRLRPDAASYARVAHAHELQGRLTDALRHMQMAAAATSPHDAESLAWHHAQIGNLQVQFGQLDAAQLEFQRANHVFAGHPYARLGLARVAAARGDIAGAMRLYQDIFAVAPTPELAATIGDLQAASGDAAGAQKMYARAEQLEREGWEHEAPQPAALARLLADRGLKVDEAVALAERAAAERSDIHTMDALAVAYFRAGRLEEAHAASVRARRTGTVDSRIIFHAAQIEAARGNLDDARALVARARAGTVMFDPLLGPAAKILARRVGLN